jgi:hypothetical protein
MKQFNSHSFLTECKIDGEILEYDYCSDSIDSYPLIKNKIYLGVGSWYSIDGILQSGKTKRHYWAKTA